MSSNGFTPRPCQVTGLDICINAPERRFIISAATGSGKNKLIQMVAKHYGNVLLITDRISVIDQLIEEQIMFGLFYDVVTSQKITKDLNKLNNYEVIIIDECHAMFVKVLSYIKTNNIKLIGFTATATKRKLMLYYEKIYTISTYNEMVKNKYLTPVEFYSTQSIRSDDLDFTSTGNISNKSMGELNKRIKNISANLVEDYLNNCNNKSCIITAPSIESARNVLADFRERGIPSDIYVSDIEVNNKERKNILKNFKSGAVKVIISVEAISKGFDAPIAKYLFDCRPRSIKDGLDGFIQVIGRIVRINGADSVATVYDYVGNCSKFLSRYAIHCEHGCTALIDKDFKVHKCERCKAEYDIKPPTICNSCKDFSVKDKPCISCQHVNDVKELSCKKCLMDFSIECPHCNSMTTYLINKCISCKKQIEESDKKLRESIAIISTKNVEMKKVFLPNYKDINSLTMMDEVYSMFASTVKYRVEEEGKVYKSPVFYALQLSKKKWEEMGLGLNFNVNAFQLYKNSAPELFAECIKFIKKEGARYYGERPADSGF
ncbi:MAG: hypothetical protein LW807_07455 [Proteobacteria bacterium]|nr:hypothetical protein [Pseudomonadota bacterium]